MSAGHEGRLPRPRRRMEEIAKPYVNRDSTKGDRAFIRNLACDALPTKCQPRVALTFPSPGRRQIAYDALPQHFSGRE